MRRFHFRLEPILQQRKWLEQQCRQAYAQAQRREVEEQQRLDTIQQRYIDCCRALDEAKREHFDIVQIQTYSALLDRIVEERERQTLRLQQVSEARAEAHARWIEADRDLKVVDKMREHALERHQKRGLVEAQHLLDELAARRQRFQMTSGGGLR